METKDKQYSPRELQEQLDSLREQLDEANDTIEAIRSGSVDAIVVRGEEGSQLYTLKSADHTYRIFIEKMAEGAVTLNSTGLVLYSNSQFAALTNRPLAQVIGLSFAEFVSTDCQQVYQDLFAHAWQQDTKGEVDLTSGNAVVPVQLSLTTLELEGGTSMSIIITDLSFQKQTERQLLQNNQKLEEANHALELSNIDLQQFASVASHDLQEPLRKITVFSTMMKQLDAGASEEASKYLDRIIFSADRMKSLITDILDYSKLAGEEPANDPVNMNILISGIITDFDLKIRDTSARVTVDHLPTVVGKKGQLRQVFQNILGNALKFSAPGVPPVIRVTSKRLSKKALDGEVNDHGPYCLIEIIDNGVGFEQKYASRIFNLFERLHSKDKYEGTGIGLAIAKKIIAKHNGTISAASEEGKGAVFSIILPCIR